MARPQTMPLLNAILQTIQNLNTSLQDIEEMLPGEEITQGWWGFKSQLETMRSGAHPLVIAMCPQYNVTFKPNLKYVAPEDSLMFIFQSLKFLLLLISHAKHDKTWALHPLQNQ